MEPPGSRPQTNEGGRPTSRGDRRTARLRQRHQAKKDAPATTCFRLSYLLAFASLLTLTALAVLSWRILAFADERIDRDRNAAYTFGMRTLQSAITALSVDFSRMERYSHQTLNAMGKYYGNFSSADSQMAEIYEDTYYNWAPRLLQPGEAQGVSISVLSYKAPVPAGGINATPNIGKDPNTVYEFVAYNYFTDPYRDGTFKCVVGLTNTTTGLSDYYDFGTVGNTTAAALANLTSATTTKTTAMNLRRTEAVEKLQVRDFQYHADDAAIISPNAFRDDYFTVPMPWVSADGNPSWYFTHQGSLAVSPTLQVVAQTYQSVQQWSEMLRMVLSYISVGRTSSTIVANVQINNEQLVVLTREGYVVAASDPDLESLASRCATGETVLSEKSLACLQAPLMKHRTSAAFRTVGRYFDSVMQQPTTVTSLFQGGASVTTLVISADGLSSDPSASPIPTLSPGARNGSTASGVPGDTFVVVINGIITSGDLQLFMMWCGNSNNLLSDAIQVRAAAVAMIVIAVLASVVTLCVAFFAFIPLAQTSIDVAKLASLSLDDVKDRRPTCVAEIADARMATKALKAGVGSLLKYMPRGLVIGLLQANQTAALGVGAKEIVIMFADLAGFTSLCENAWSRPHLVTKTLNGFFSVAVAAVRLHNGVVDKFIGDCVMAFWSDVPGSRKDVTGLRATCAICAALAIHGASLINYCESPDAVEPPKPNATPTTAATVPSPGSAAPSRGGSIVVVPTQQPQNPPAAVGSLNDVIGGSTATTTPTASATTNDVDGQQQEKRFTRQGTIKRGRKSLEGGSVGPIMTTSPTTTTPVTSKPVGDHHPAADLMNSISYFDVSPRMMPLHGGGGESPSRSGPGTAPARVVGASLSPARGSIVVPPPVRPVNAVLKVRFGLHAGTALIGNIGCNERLSFTAIGDVVNVASRLESFGKQLNCSPKILASASVIRNVHRSIVARVVGPVQLVGRDAPVQVCQVLGIDEDALNKVEMTTASYAGIRPKAFYNIHNRLRDPGSKAMVPANVEPAHPLSFLSADMPSKNNVAAATAAASAGNHRGSLSGGNPLQPVCSGEQEMGGEATDLNAVNAPVLLPDDEAMREVSGTATDFGKSMIATVKDLVSKTPAVVVPGHVRAAVKLNNDFYQAHQIEIRQMAREFVRQQVLAMSAPTSSPSHAHNHPQASAFPASPSSSSIVRRKTVENPTIVSTTSGTYSLPPLEALVSMPTSTYVPGMDTQLAGSMRNPLSSTQQPSQQSPGHVSLISSVTTQNASDLAYHRPAPATAPETTTNLFSLLSGEPFPSMTSAAAPTTTTVLERVVNDICEIFSLAALSSQRQASSPMSSALDGSLRHSKRSSGKMTTKGMSSASTVEDAFDDDDLGGDDDDEDDDDALPLNESTGTHMSDPAGFNSVGGSSAGSMYFDAADLKALMATGVICPTNK